MYQTHNICTMLVLVNMKKSDDLPKWIRIAMVILKNWKETVGSLFILVNDLSFNFFNYSEYFTQGNFGFTMY